MEERKEGGLIGEGMLKIKAIGKSRSEGARWLVKGVKNWLFETSKVSQREQLGVEVTEGKGWK